MLLVRGLRHTALCGVHGLTPSQFLPADFDELVGPAIEPAHRALLGHEELGPLDVVLTLVAVGPDGELSDHQVR